MRKPCRAAAVGARQPEICAEQFGFREIDERLESHSREVGESFSALRLKIHEGNSGLAIRSCAEMDFTRCRSN